jgi:hypothetical protein
MFPDQIRKTVYDPNKRPVGSFSRFTSTSGTFKLYSILVQMDRASLFSLWLTIIVPSSSTYLQFL